MAKRVIEIAIIACLLASSCTKTVYIPQTRTEYVNRERVDSLFIHDSVFVRERVKGDTVYLTRDRWRTEYRDRLRIDTIVRTDSISYPVEVVRTETKMNGFQRFFFWLGIGFTLALILWIAVKIYMR